MNEGLSDDEKLIVLAHELGHIVCGHMVQSNIIGSDVQEEYQANEFAHYVLKPGVSSKLQRYVWSNAKAVCAVAMIAAIIIAIMITFIVVSNEKTYYSEYYITESGQKYHKKKCIFVKDKSNVHKLTNDQIESGEYEPCRLCLPK